LNSFRFVAIIGQPATQNGEPMLDDAYRNLCIYHIHDGLRDGLSHFSQSSRAALIYAETPHSAPRIHDPQNLLRGHEPMLEKVFLKDATWRQCPGKVASIPPFEQILCDPLPMSGLINVGTRSRAIFHQTWFTEHHPDLCSTGPTERWLEHASWMLSQAFASDNVLHLDLAGAVLQGWATHAVRNFIVDQRAEAMGMDTKLRIYPTLDAILSISKTLEEGAWARGRLCFVEPGDIDSVTYLAKFTRDERPVLQNHKHVRKLLLSVEDSPYALVSDGASIVGIGMPPYPGAFVLAKFRGNYGFVRLGEEKVCSFFDGAFHSTTRRANLVQLEELLLESRLDPTQRHALFTIVSDIVHSTQERKHGCTLVLDFSCPHIPIAGQHLENPISLHNPHMLHVAKALAKVDGALHICADGTLHGFGCLLDGERVVAEDRSRGARYNSALRFTAGHDDLVVIVVSSDRPMSIIQGGVEVTAACPLPPLAGSCGTPPHLEDWIADA
jgi:DNA integrity scanning protein DisA with diadenylate cyclase activity